MRNLSNPAKRLSATLCCAISVFALVFISFSTQTSALPVGSTTDINQSVASPNQHAVRMQRISAQAQAATSSTSGVTQGGSDNWSGYVATSNTKFVAAETVYNQPTVTCPVANAQTSFWVGFDGYTNGTVEQDGTAATCSSTKQVSYYAWWEMFPTNAMQKLPLTIRPGDKMENTVTYATNGVFTMTVNDLTTGKHATATAKAGAGQTCARQTAEWVVERTGQSLKNSTTYNPLADWGTVRINTDEAATTTTTNSKTKVVTPVMKSVAAYNDVELTMYDNDGNPLVSLSGLQSTNDTAFNDTWEATQ